MSIWCLRGRTLVSWCKCAVGVVFVQPVAIRSAAFCVTCSLCKCVSAMSGDQAVWVYVSMGLMNCLYIVQSEFGFRVDVVCMCFERHSSVKCDSKDFGGVGDRYGPAV